MLGASPRAGIALAKAAKARAMIKNRSYVTPDDVKALAAPVLSHRLVADSSQGGISVLETIIEKIPAPVDWKLPHIK